MADIENKDQPQYILIESSDRKFLVALVDFIDSCKNPLKDCTTLYVSDTDPRKSLDHV